MAFTRIGNSAAVAVTSSGVRAQLTNYAPSCRVYNEGPNAARIAFGDSSVTAGDFDLIIPPGLMEIEDKSINTHIAAITKPGETATLHIICGSGD